VTALGFEIIGPESGANASGITTFRHAIADMPALFRALEQNRIVASLRFDRAGAQYIRLSPHFYNTQEEIARVIETLRHAL
jgi:selenocysteine lyase/cysteine desulfurase